MSIVGRFRRWRDRLLSDPGFQRWAASTPLIRVVARREARAAFDLASGFVYTQILTACVEVGLFEHLRAGPSPIESIARATGLDTDAAARLLEAARSLRLVEPRGESGDPPAWGLGPIGAALLGNPGALAMIEHNRMFYDDIRDPVALLRGEVAETRLGRFWAYARSSAPSGSSADEVAEYSRLMAASQSFIADDVIAAYPFRRHQRLLDIGGGEGRFANAVARAVPGISVTTFDLPAVADRARERFADAGLGDRATAVGGDFFRDALPKGRDVVTLVRVVHDHDDPAVLAILKAARAAIADDGTLVIAEPMAGTRGAETVGAAYFGLYLLAMGSGRARTVAELRDLLVEAGFQAPREHPTRQPLLTSVVSTRPRV